MRKLSVLFLIYLFLLSCKEIKSPHSPSISSSLPAISFTAEPNQIMGGEVSLLSWRVTNGISATLSDGKKTVVVNLIDTREMYPKETTIYVLAASNESGSAQVKAKVDVYESANVLFKYGSVVLYRYSDPYIEVQGDLKNEGNITAINIYFHVEVFDPLGNPLVHLTQHFIHPTCDCSRLERGWSHRVEYVWHIDKSICDQIDEYTQTWKLVYATWTNEN